MRKAYVIADCLSDDNKREIKKTAGECGFDVAFFDTDAEASGKVSDAEVIYARPQVVPLDVRGRWTLSCKRSL